MHVTKLRVCAGESGLVPAGRYFEKLAEGLRAARTETRVRRIRASSAIRGRDLNA
jgi:hypothetical protein